MKNTTSLFGLFLCGLVGCSTEVVSFTSSELNELNQPSEPDMVVVEPEEMAQANLFLKLPDEIPLQEEDLNPCICSWVIEERTGMVCLRRQCSPECENQECEELGLVCRPMY